MGQLIVLDDFDNFKEVRRFPAVQISRSVIATVKTLDEREEIEPFLRSIIFDSNSTAHGPAEIVDILTHKLSDGNDSGLAAFIIKGKSFRIVRPKDISHQIYRLEKIADLRYAILVTSGTILDAAKEQFCATAKRLKLRYSILDAIDLARLFVSYGFICPRDGSRISAGRCNCGYSPGTRILNVLQREALRATKDAYQLGQRRGLIVVPPGGGKTRISAQFARDINANQIVYIAHTHEILEVAQSEFEAIFSTKEVTHHVKSSTLRNPNRVNLVTIQLLSRHFKYFGLKSCDFLIVDEFHHAAAKSYRNLIAKMNPSFLLGLTATPFRGDRQDILDLCDQNMFANYELRSGIDMGILCPYHYFGCFDDIEYSNIRLKGNSCDIRDLEKTLIIPERNEAIFSKWLEHANGKLTLAFCVSHRHAERVSSSFQERGISSEVYLSNTAFPQRQQLQKKFRQGHVKVLCVVDVMNEGVDLPSVECLLFLRPTESKRIFYQQLGRGLRKYVGKSHCTVIDFIGNFRNAYKIVEYQGLMPFIDEGSNMLPSRYYSGKEILNLPLGCEVTFDERVIDIFSQQTLGTQKPSRHNIGRILIYQYEKLHHRLGHWPTRKEVDQNQVLNSDFYKLVFRSWKEFEELMRSR